MRGNPSFGRRSRFSVVVLLLAAAPGLGAQTAASESDVATVVGSVFDPARDEPVQGVRVFLVGTPYGTTTDEAGRFRIDAPLNGRYEVVAWHRELVALRVDPPRYRVTLEPGEVTEVALSVPVRPRAAALAAECPDPARPGGMLGGAVQDPESGVPIPGVRVRLAWRDGAGEERAAAVTSRADGTWLACGLPVGERIHARARFLEEVGEAALSLTLGPEGLALRDLMLRPERTVAATLSGVLEDQATGQPIPAAVVRLPALGREAVTDGSGRFVLQEVTTGIHDLEVEHLAYGVRRDRVEVTGEAEQLLRVRVPMEAIDLGVIEVVARSAAEEYRRRSGANVHLFTRRDIEERAAVARNAAEVIQGKIPGVTIRKVRLVSPEPTEPVLCIMTMRRSVTPMAMRGRLPCVDIVVDGRRLGPGEGALYMEYSLPPDQIESIEFIPPIRAGFKYGTGAVHGVLEIWTRDNGPWAERGRQ